VDFLAARFPHVPRPEWQRRLARGLVYDDGGTPLAAAALCEGHARLHYFREVAAEPLVPFDEEVLAVEDDFVVAYKPPLLPVTPGGAHVTACLLHRLQQRLGEPGLVPVHRLDRDTSGVMVFARNPAAAAQLGAQFAARQVDRRYEAVAVASGEAGARWEVANCLGAGEPWFRTAIVGGEPNAWTDITLSRIAVGGGGSPARQLAHYTLVPSSGRKHQLRLHMASIGSPILNDRLYPELQPEAAPDPTHPLQLAAVALGFMYDERRCRFVAPRRRLVEQLAGEDAQLRALWSSSGDRPQKGDVPG
jgi:tRNA pseudouridine32 synthase/23S rRNA pseudouridine746 synthase